MKFRTLQIEAPHFVAGILIYDEVLLNKPAPIIKYMRFWSVERILSYCNKKKWKVRWI